MTEGEINWVRTRGTLLPPSLYDAEPTPLELHTILEEGGPTHEVGTDCNR